MSDGGFNRIFDARLIETKSRKRHAALELAERHVDAVDVLHMFSDRSRSEEGSKGKHEGYSLPNVKGSEENIQGTHRYLRPRAMKKTSRELTDTSDQGQ
eukprot:30504-Chlamydomonas_euryale.AAC.4